MAVVTPPSKGVRSRKRKREVEELNSPSADAVSEKNLRETAPMILARWKTTAYKGSSEPRRLAELVKEIEVSTSLATEEDFRPQKARTKRVRRKEKRGKWMLAKNGSRASIRLLGNKWSAILLRRMRQRILLDLGGLLWRQLRNWMTA